MQLDKSFLIFICFIVVILKFCFIFVENKNKETMTSYLNTLISEKNLNLQTIIEVEGKECGTNFIPLESVVEFVNELNPSVQSKIKNNLIKIDFHNGDVMHFFKYIAQGMAI